MAKKIYPVPPSFAKNAYLDEHQYQTLYDLSIKNPEQFWSQQAELIDWISPWKNLVTGDFTTLNIQWFMEGKLNACSNCVDRHLNTRKNKTAIIWQGDDPNEKQSFSYGELHEKISRLANVLKKLGVKKGDRVCIYLPMIPEVVISMLACVRIGAIHSIVFSAFSSESLKIRILDSDCKLLITADEGIRGGKVTSLKEKADTALQSCPKIKHVIVVKRTDNKIPWDNKRDVDYQEAIQAVDAYCPIESMDADDPLFILYTSGSTGKPKGVLHSTAGYLVYVATTFKYVFNYQDGDIYWCTADVGWITGHSYLIYGPLLNGATTLLFEGVPHYPTFSRYWEVVDQFKVNIFYTAPTAIRALRKEGDEWVKKTDRSSLKLLGTVGEPISPDVWKWYHDIAGNKKCPIVDTWWQTETGGIMISSLPGTPLKPGAAGKPFFGIVPKIVNDQGDVIKTDKAGKLIIQKPWPGLMKTIYSDQKRFVENYFQEVPNHYFTGDNAFKDQDDYFWIIGRDDDVIKVSGHRLGTGELESALLSHPSVAEAAVVAIPDDIKGHGIYAFVTTQSPSLCTEQLKKELIEKVQNELGPFAKPTFIQWANDLPKTRSGKIMRRLLRLIAMDEFANLGDTSTLAEPKVVNDLINERKKITKLK